jgi:hypothetical protein
MRSAFDFWYGSSGTSASVLSDAEKIQVLVGQLSNSNNGSYCSAFSPDLGQFLSDVAGLPAQGPLNMNNQQAVDTLISNYDNLVFDLQYCQLGV